MRRIEIVPYDRRWPDLFETEKRYISEALGGIVENTHHIGSTSVPGLAAKPVIDIVIEVSSLTELDEFNSELENLGYEPMGEYGIEHRRYFRKGGDDRTHHIHAFKSEDPHVIRHLAFRDYLKAHPAVLNEYQELKIRVAASCNNDIGCYCDGKDVFIKKHEKIALEWLPKRTQQ